MKLLRTPEDRFESLPDFDVRLGYVEVADPDGGTVRMGYAETGPPTGQVVLLLHGEPTWSYLYRAVMRGLAQAGLRSVAIDLVGFGRSDKPAQVADHTYARHVEWVRAAAFDALDLDAVTLVGQDWGGLIGLRLVAEHPDRFARVVATNTGLPTGDHAMPEVWHRFRDAVRSAERLDIGRFVASGCVRGLGEQARAAYDAPFPDESFKAGPRALPGLVPTTPDDPASEANRRAWAQLTEWERPFLVAFSDGDPITGGMAPILRRVIPAAARQPEVTISNAGHFVQEDAGPDLAATIIDFIDRAPVR